MKRFFYIKTVTNLKQWTGSVTIWTNVNSSDRHNYHATMPAGPNCYERRGISMLFFTPFDAKSPQYYRIASVSLSSELHVMEVGYNRTPKGLRQVMKRDVYILHYVTDGCGTFCGESFDSTGGYLVCPGELEMVEADSEQPYEAYWIMFQGSGAVEFLKKCGLSLHNSVFSFSQTRECAEILRNALFDIKPQSDWEEASLMQAAFYRVLAIHLTGFKGQGGGDTVAQKVKEFIQKNYYNDISVENMAKSFHFSRNYLYMLFKKEHGISPQAYLLNYRIEKAKELLRYEQNLSVSEVARAVGFRDPLYFSRIFHKKVGVPPSEF